LRDEWNLTFDTNVGAMFRLTRAAVSQMRHGASVINTIDHRGQTQPRAAPLCDNERRDPELHGWPCATARGAGHTRELRGAGANLDAADSIDDAARKGQALRRAGADEASRATGRSSAAVCHARVGRGELHIGATIAVTGGAPML
jgi:hypothetical protein